jgi:hypothetical protein
MLRKLIFLSASTFFGLTLKYRANIFTQIHEIVFYGKGGYDWHTVYDMPIWLRNFTFNKINEHYQNEKEAHDKANQNPNTTTVMDSTGKIQAPELVKSAGTSYNTKSSKK